MLASGRPAGSGRGGARLAPVHSDHAPNPPRAAGPVGAACRRPPPPRTGAARAPGGARESARPVLAAV